MKIAQQDIYLAKILGKPHKGKVRDSYPLKATHRRRPLRLSVVSYRWSIFDFPMGFPNPGQAEALNAFNIAARYELTKALPDIEDDLIADGVAIERYLPTELHGDAFLQSRSTVVEDLVMVGTENGGEGIECVVRGSMTGKLRELYLAKKSLWGYDLPPGIPEGAKLEPAMFTPTTKAKKGPDLPVTREFVAQKVDPNLESDSIAVYNELAKFSLKRGVIGADTKLEWGRRRNSDGTLDRRVLADEVWTPHSSRFWSKEEYVAVFPKSIPEPMDKQIGREWGKKMGIDKMNSKSKTDRAKVFKMVAPEEIMSRMRERTEKAFEMLHGLTVQQFLLEELRIK